MQNAERAPALSDAELQFLIQVLLAALDRLDSCAEVLAAAKVNEALEILSPGDGRLKERLR